MAVAARSVVREEEVVAKTFRALGDPVRFRLVELLLERGELTVSELTAALPVSQPRVSVHLRCLSECGFATVQRQGRHAYYRASGPHLSAVVELMRKHAETNRESILACLTCAPEGKGGSACC